MADIVVIGAGISGLATAWFLGHKGHRVRVLEAGREPGGTIRTLERDGYLVEAGPNSTLSKGGAFDDLVQAVGVGETLVEGNRLSKNRFVVKHGLPMTLPMSPPAFLKTSLFSNRAKLRLLLEPFQGRATREETVAEFVRRRLGPEFLDWAIDPFVSGVYAGDPDRLSARAATAKVYALEREHGSLIVGALVRALRGRSSGPQPAGRLVSFRSGMQALPRAIAAALGDAARFSEAAIGIERTRSGAWQVDTGSGMIEAEHVVIATAADHAATLLAPLAPAAAEELRGIRYPPIASVALGFDRGQIAHPLDGFGMLIPRREARATLGTLFSSTLFPGRAPEGKVLLTAFIGGARNTAIAEVEDSAVLARVMTDLRPLLGIRGDPGFTLITRWARAIPQYELGHLERLARVDAALARLPGLHTRANWRDGISVADCVANARTFAHRFSGA